MKAAKNTANVAGRIEDAATLVQMFEGVFAAANEIAFRDGDRHTFDGAWAGLARSASELGEELKDICNGIVNESRNKAGLPAIRSVKR